MSIAFPILFNIITFYSIMAGFYLYVIKKPARFANFAKWKHSELKSKLKLCELEEKLAALGKNGMFLQLTKSGDLIYFRDKPSMRSWGNSYVIQTDPMERYTLYYSGSMLKSRVNKYDLSNTMYILENVQ